MVSEEPLRLLESTGSEEQTEEEAELVEGEIAVAIQRAQLPSL